VLPWLKVLGCFLLERSYNTRYSLKSTTKITIYGTEGEKLNVVGYIRVLIQGQARDGYSLKYQEDEIKAYCEVNNLNLIHIFKYEGISGAKLNEEALEIDRVGLQEMLAHLSSVHVDYVVVLDTSRLWRSDIVKVLIQRELKKYGYDIKSIEQPFYSIHNILVDTTTGH